MSQKKQLRRVGVKGAVIFLSTSKSKKIDTKNPPSTILCSFGLSVGNTIKLIGLIIK